MAGNGGEEILGARYPKVDAWERVTGHAAYGADLHLPGMLHGKVLRSPHPHAIIKGIDTSKAERYPGVKAVITHRDLPPLEKGGEAFGGELVVEAKDLQRLTIAHEKALFEGHAIAAVAATTPEVAEEVLDLIEVEYEVLPPVESALEAMKPDAPLLHPDLFTKSLQEKLDKPSNIAMYMEQGWGNVEQGFQEADVVVEHTYDTMMVHQGYIEPQACAARWESDTTVTVWTTIQGTFSGQRMLATLLQTPLNRINVVPMEVGGGFGGKIYVNLEPLAVLLARKSGRPVKMVMDRAEVFRATGPGSPQHATIKVGARKDGRIVAAYARLVMDAGAFPGAPVAGAALVSFGPYKMENFKLEAYDVVTNKPRVQAYRAPGGTPVAFSVGSVMDEVAGRLGMDPLEFHQINAAGEGDPMTNGRPYSRGGLSEVLRRVQEGDHWNSPLEGPNRGRGLGVGFWQGATLTATSIANLNVDGTVEVITGQVDLTGIRTSMLQMVAWELQVPPDWVIVRVGDTFSTTYTDLSAGSRSTYTQSQALFNACQEILRKLGALAADQLKLSVEDIEYAQGKFWARDNPETSMTWKELAARSRSRGGGPICGYGSSGRLRGSPCFAAHVADVEVDPETGKVKLLRYTCFHDPGKAINPTLVEGQIQGGATQGLGWALTEYYAYDQGKLLNPTLLDYRILTAVDLPMLDTDLTEVPASDGPYGARGIGEVPIVPPGATIANAVYRAVGVRMKELPMTPERVFWAIQARERELEGAAAGE